MRVNNKSTMVIVGAITMARVFECFHSSSNRLMIALFENSGNEIISYCKAKNKFS